MVLAVLFSVYMPTNAAIIYRSILQMVNFEFFTMEEFYVEKLHINKGESFSPAFDEAQMDGSSFVIGIGPIIVSILIFPVYFGIHKLA